MEKCGGFEDNRGVIFWTSTELLDFDYKYLTIGTIKPKGVRGGHYHKKTCEKLLCVKGPLLAVIDKETTTMENGDIIDIPTSSTHLFINIGDEEAFFIEFKDRIFAENDKDTFTE